MSKQQPQQFKEDAVRHYYDHSELALEVAQEIEFYHVKFWLDTIVTIFIFNYIL